MKNIFILLLASAMVSTTVGCAEAWTERKNASVYKKIRNDCYEIYKNESADSLKYPDCVSHATYLYNLTHSPMEK